MNQIEKVEKKITDALPLDKYFADNIKAGVETSTIESNEIFYKASDLELFFQKLGQPKIISQVVKNVMFGGALDLEKILSEVK